MSAATSGDKLGFKGFTDSKTYENVRPGYPREAVEFMLKKLGALNEDGTATERKFTILELGAGTGKLTRVMVDVLRGAENVRIVASDPLQGMCKTFREMLPGVEIKQFAAENIDLSDESVHAVVAAASFHWFCNQKSLDEIHRVLVPGGKLGLVWTLFLPNASESKWLREIYEYLDVLYKKYSHQMISLHRKEVTQKIPKETFTEPKDTEDQFCFSINTDVNSLYQLLSSFSVVTTCTQQEKAQFNEFYRHVIDKYFTSQGKELQSVTFATPVVWCEKKKNEAKH